jgi:hypothetical protein
MRAAACAGLLLGSLAMVGSAVAQDAARAGAAPAERPRVERELIYGAELMTHAERERYRQRIGAAAPGSAEKLRDDHQRQIRERARRRGVQLVEPAGTVSRP